MWKGGGRKGHSGVEIICTWHVFDFNMCGLKLRDDLGFQVVTWDTRFGHGDASLGNSFICLELCILFFPEVDVKSSPKSRANVTNTLGEAAASREWLWKSTPTTWLQIFNPSLEMPWHFRGPFEDQLQQCRVLRQMYHRLLRPLQAQWGSCELTYSRVYIGQVTDWHCSQVSREACRQQFW